MFFLPVGICILPSINKRMRQFVVMPQRRIQGIIFCYYQSMGCVLPRSKEYFPERLYFPPHPPTACSSAKKKKTSRHPPNIASLRSNKISSEYHFGIYGTSPKLSDLLFLFPPKERASLPRRKFESRRRFCFRRRSSEEPSLLLGPQEGIAGRGATAGAGEELSESGAQISVWWEAINIAAIKYLKSICF